MRVTANPSLRPRLPGGPLVLRPCVGDFFSCLPLVLFGAGSRFRNRPLVLLPCRLSTALKKSSLYIIIHRPPQNNCLGYDSGTKKHIVGLLPVAQLSSQSSAVESLESGSRRHGLPRRGVEAKRGSARCSEADGGARFPSRPWWLKRPPTLATELATGRYIAGALGGTVPIGQAIEQSGESDSRGDVTLTGHEIEGETEESENWKG